MSETITIPLPGTKPVTGAEIFKKTPQEKEQAKKAKAEWKKNQKSLIKTSK